MRSFVFGAAVIWIVVAGLAQHASAGLVIYTFSFTGDVTGNATSISPGADPNFLVSAFTIGNSLGTVNAPISSTSASSGYTGATGGNNIGNAFRSGPLVTATSAFVSFSVTNTTGGTQSLTDFDFGVRRTSTGPTAYSLLVGPSFGSEITSGVINNDNSWRLANNTFTQQSVATGVTEFRLYGYGNPGTPSNNIITGRFDDFTVTFNITAVPEPSSLMLLGVTGAIAGVVRVRRFRFKHRGEGI